MILTLQFAQFPRPGGGSTARPAVDLVVNGVEEAPVRCLLDTGAAHVRLPASIAADLGVDLSRAEPGAMLLLGGVRTRAYDVEVALACAGYSWSTTVSFCDPDYAGFGLAGLVGFFDRIHVCVDGYLGEVQLEPHEDRLHRLRLNGGDDSG